MKLGIIGKPQSGKTTVFNAASGHQEAVGDFSQSVHRAVIKVPDERIDRLSEIFSPKKTTHAEIEFLDAPGFTGKGKDSGGAEIPAELRLMEALVLVIDAFSPRANPARDIQDLIDEMILADQVVVENNLEKKTRKIRLTGDKAGARELQLLETCRQTLEEGKLLIELDLPEADRKTLRGYAFLTQKPLLIVANISEAEIKRATDIKAELGRFAADGRRDVTALCGKIEMELAALDAEERQLFMAELGIDEPAVSQLIQNSYALLGLISFITVGEPEVRAWTIKSGTPALKAAGAIHSDIERGFIRAEVVKYEDYVKFETLAAAKAAGKAHLEGKEYVVQDGDVILFRFNV